MTPTMDTALLPSLESRYDISDAQKAAFRGNGHIYLPGVCSPEEISSCRREILDATAEPRAAATDLEKRDTYGKAFLQMMNLWVGHEGVKQFVFGKRIAEIAAELMGVSGTRLYHDQALFKEGRGGYTPWHQDQHYWPLDTLNTITVWIPLVDLTADMGIMQFASKSHVNGYLSEMGAISDESEAKIDEFVGSKGYEVTGQPVMKAGDATFHYGWTLHRAPGNQTDTMREVMTTIYFADGTRILKPDNPWREDDLKNWLGGGRPGDLAQGELNPLLYSA